jgi:hypothetical protein
MITIQLLISHRLFNRHCRCYGLDTSTPIDSNTDAWCPSHQYAGGTSGKFLGALTPIVLEGVSSTEDISLVIHSAAFEIRRWKNQPLDACSVASVDQITSDNSTCYMNILNWDGTTCGTERYNTISSKVFPDVEIAGCGVGCGPYTPPTAVDNNDCTAALVESGKTCNIVCPSGLTAVGAPVSCQAGSYVGGITCTNSLFAWIGDVRDDSTAAIPGANLNQIMTVSGPGCGEYTAVGTTCHITCAFGYFSTGTVEVQDISGVATWVPSANAQCVATTCGTGTAIPTQGVVTPNGQSETQVSGYNFMNDATVEVGGFSQVHSRRAHLDVQLRVSLRTHTHTRL